MTVDEELVPGYQVVSELGSGAFAQVYLAHQVSLDRKIALKVMNPQMAGDKDLCERFIAEARLVARLRHSSIVAIYDIGKHNDIYYISMEYLAGNTLNEYIKKQTFPASPLAIIRQIASALQYAHDHGIVHRDVKPANVLFDVDRKAILSDFGIAKNLDADVTMTAVGSTMGTPAYMSPEQIRGNQVDGRTDLYSLGVMLFEMLAGKKPFAGGDYFETIMQHLNEPVPKLPPNYAEFQSIVEKLMAKDQDDRFSSATELIAYLDQTESMQAGEARPHRPRSPRQFWKFRKFRLLYTAIPIILVLLVGSLYVARRLEIGQGESLVEISNQRTAPVAPVSLSPDEQGKVDSLLEMAELHELIGRINAPPGANALEAYQQVLTIDPSNQAARDALGRLGAE